MTVNYPFEIDCEAEVSTNNRYILIEHHKRSTECFIYISPDYESIPESVTPPLITIVDIYSSSTSRTHTLSVKLSQIDHIYFQSPQIVNENTISNFKIKAIDKDQQVFDSLKGLDMQLILNIQNKSYFYSENISDYFEFNSEYSNSSLSILDSGALSFNTDFVKFKGLKYGKFDIKVKLYTFEYQDVIIIKKNLYCPFKNDIKILPLTMVDFWLQDKKEKYYNLQLTSSNPEWVAKTHYLSSVDYIDSTSIIKLNDNDQFYPEIDILSYSFKVTTVEPTSMSIILIDSEGNHFTSNSNKDVFISTSPLKLTLNVNLHDKLNDLIYTNSQLDIDVKIKVNDKIETIKYINDIEIPINASMITLNFVRNKNTSSLKNDYTLDLPLSQSFQIKRSKELGIDILDSRIIQKYKSSEYISKYNKDGTYILVPTNSDVTITITNGSGEYNYSLDDLTNANNHPNLFKVEDESSFKLKFKPSLNANYLLTVCDKHYKYKNKAVCRGFVVEAKGSYQNVSKFGNNAGSNIYEVLNYEHLGLPVYNNMNVNYSLCSGYSKHITWHFEGTENNGLEISIQDKDSDFLADKKNYLDSNPLIKYSDNFKQGFSNSCVYINVNCTNDKYTKSLVTFVFDKNLKSTYQIECLDYIGIESNQPDKLLLTPNSIHTLDVFGGPNTLDKDMNYSLETDVSIYRTGDKFLEHKLKNDIAFKEYEDNINYNSTFISYKVLENDEFKSLELMCIQPGSYKVTIYRYNYNSKFSIEQNRFLYDLDINCEIPEKLALQYYSTIVFRNYDDLNKMPIVSMANDSDSDRSFGLKYINYENKLFDSVDSIEFNFDCMNMENSDTFGYNLNLGLSQAFGKNKKGHLMEKYDKNICQVVKQRNNRWRIESTVDYFMLQIEAKKEYLKGNIENYRALYSTSSIRDNFVISFAQKNSVEPYYPIYNLYINDYIEINLLNINNYSDIELSSIYESNFNSIFNYSLDKENNILKVSANIQYQEYNDLVNSNNLHGKDYVYTISIKNKILVNTSDINLKFNVIVPDSINLTKQELKYFIYNNELQTVANLCLNKACLVKESIQYSNLNIDTQDSTGEVTYFIDLMHLRLDKNTMHIRYSGNKYLDNQRLVVEWIDKDNDIDTSISVDALFSPEIGLNYIDNNITLLPDSETHFNIANIKNIGLINLEIKCESDNMRDIAYYIHGGCKLKAKSTNQSSVLTIEVRFKDKELYYITSNPVIHQNYTVQQPSDIKLNQPEYFVIGNNYILTYNLTKETDSQLQYFYPSYASSISIQLSHDREVSTHYDKYNSYIVLSFTTFGSYTLTLSVLINDSVVMSKTFTLVCYDNKKLKRDIANTRSMYGVLIDAQVDMNENIDDFLQVEILKNQDYSKKKYRLNAPGQLNKEFIINLDQAVYKIRTMEPEYIFLLRDIDKYMLGHFMSAEHLEYLKDTTLQKGNSYTFDIVMINHQGIRFLSNQKSDAIVSRLFVSDSTLAEVAINQWNEIEVMPLESGILLVEVEVKYEVNNIAHIMRYRQLFTIMSPATANVIYQVVEGGKFNFIGYRSFYNEIKAFTQDTPGLNLLDDRFLYFEKAGTYNKTLSNQQQLTFYVVKFPQSTLDTKYFEIDKFDIMNDIEVENKLPVIITINDIRIYNKQYIHYVPDNQYIDNEIDYYCSTEMRTIEVTTNVEDQTCTIKILKNNLNIFSTPIKIDIFISSKDRGVISHETIVLNANSKIITSYIQEKFDNQLRESKVRSKIADHQNVKYNLVMIVLFIAVCGGVILYMFPKQATTLYYKTSTAKNYNHIVDDKDENYGELNMHRWMRRNIENKIDKLD